MTILLLLGSQPLTGHESIARLGTRVRTYVQGSAVKIWADVYDADTGLVVTELEDIIATISQPDGTVDTRRLTDSSIDTDDFLPGRYWCMLDTSPSAGAWVYQFTTVGDDAVVAKARFHVREAVPMGV